MNMFNKLPYFVNLQERKYKINADFRVMVELEQTILNNELKKRDKIKKILQMFYPSFSSEENYNILIKNTVLYEEACNRLIWFYTRGKKNYHKNVKGISSQDPRQIYSYEYDEDYIFGAFWDRGFDLTKDFIHWWKFKALLLSMNEDVPFEKIKGYRAYSGDDEQLKNLKRYWELPLSYAEQQRQDKLYELLK